MTARKTPKFSSREEWLNAFVTAARPKFKAIGSELPKKVRVSVGFPSKGQRSNTIGECWQPEATSDKVSEIFIRPSLQSTPSRIADVLTHELIHACGISGHARDFKKVALGLGLEGKMTATVAGAGWHEWADPIVKELGLFPGAELKGSIIGGKKKQSTRMLKLLCDSCGWTCRTAAKHIEPYDVLDCPTQCGGTLEQK